MTDDSAGEGFLQRWSRRKRGEPGEADGQEELQPEAVEAAMVADAPEAEEDPDLVANREAAEAVDLESLTYESDFTIFMKKGVPSALKNAALRKLWRSNPVLAVVDGLNDYDEDFRVAEGVAGQFASAWKVGKGYADKGEEVAAEMREKSAKLAELRENSLKNPDVLSGGQDTAPGLAAGEHSPQLEEGQPDPVDEVASASLEKPGGEVRFDAPKAPARRRMQFDMDE